MVLDLQGALMTGGLGTFQWMAPEVLAHQRYSEKADVFSCAPLSPVLHACATLCATCEAWAAAD